MRRMIMLNIFGNLSNIISLHSKKKLGSYDMSNRLYGRKRTKVWTFENPLSESGCRNTWETPFFWLKTFFQRLLENFLSVVWSCSIYLETCLTSYLYARKKIRVIRHVKQIIWKETYKSLDFWKIHSQNRFDVCYKKVGFWPKTFFQRLLENFLSVVWQR